jgi:cellulose synthase/poly-beta-1,6-N-acetylglucosamine synthase-like glycosyltransferase
MPETLRGLWSSASRWAEGGVEMMVDFFRPDDHAAGRRACCRPTATSSSSLLWAYAWRSA